MQKYNLKFIIYNFLLVLLLFYILHFIFYIPYVYAQTPAVQPGAEEKAVENLNRGLDPAEVATSVQADNRNLFQRVGDGLKGLLGSLFWGGIGGITDEKKLFSQSETLQQGNAPKELKPNDAEDPQQQETEFLSKPGGFYGADLPEFSDVPTRDIKRDEKNYECAYFPCKDGIHPVTGRQ